MIPYRTNRVHNRWTWWYHFGTGDMGNDGVHDIDYTRWGLGVDTHPTKVSAIGGKFFFDDDQEFPDTQQVTFEYPGDGKPAASEAADLRAAAVVDELSAQHATAAPSSTAPRGRCSSAAAARSKFAAKRNRRRGHRAFSPAPRTTRPRRELLRCDPRQREAECRRPDRPSLDDPVPSGQHRHATRPLARVRSEERKGHDDERPTPWSAASTATTGARRRGREDKQLLSMEHDDVRSADR